MNDFLIGSMGERKRKSTPAGVRVRPAFTSSPADIGTLGVVVENTIGLVLFKNRKHVRPSFFGSMCSSIKPNDGQLSVLGGQLFAHSLAHFIVVGLPVCSKFVISVYFEVV